MNLKRITIALLAFGALFTACQQEEELGVPKLTVTPAEVSLEKGEATQAVELLATRDWYLSSSPDWAAVSVVEGKASSKPQTVTVSVNANPGYDRTGEIRFSIGLAKASLVINQKGEKGELSLGSGTKEDPYTVAGVIAYVQSLGSDVESPASVFFKGIVSAVSTTFEGSGTYGNATFYIKDPDGGDQFYCYQTYYLGNRKWKKGDAEIKVDDEVIMCGKVVNYKGNTPETVGKGGSFIYSLNGKTEGGEPADPGKASGSGTKEDPFNVAAAINAVQGLTWTSNDVFDKVGPYYVKGVISAVDDAYAAQFGNGSFHIKDADGSAEFYVYRALYLGNKKWTSKDTQIKEGDEVIIYAELMNYRGNTPETVQNGGYLYSLNGQTQSGTTPPDPGNTGEPSGDGTLDSPYNAAAAYQVASGLDAESKTGDVYLAGKISSIKYTFSAQYGTATFNISDDGGTSGSQFTCYSVYYLQNTAWKDGQTQVKVGDSVIVYGKLCNYQGNTPETSSKEAYIYSLNGQTEPETPGTTDPPSGDGVVIDLAAQGYANAADFSSITVNGVTLSGDMGSNSKNGPKYYNTGSAVRFYSGNTFTVSCSKAITKITLEFGSGDGTNEIAASPGTYAEPVWTGSAESVTFTVGGTTGHRRIAKVSVEF